MNKKIFGFIVAMFIATSAQAYPDHSSIYYVTNKVTKNEFNKLSVHIKGLSDCQTYRNECKIRDNFEQNTQAGMLIATGTVMVGFFGCLFMEWLQEFKVRKAEKAALIARIQCKMAQEQAACCIAA